MSAMHEPRSALPAVHEMDFHGDRLLLVDVDPARRALVLTIEQGIPGPE